MSEAATNAGSKPEPFRSAAQVRDAMADGRYRADPAYRAEVADRLAASKAAGINPFNV